MPYKNKAFPVVYALIFLFATILFYASVDVYTLVSNTSLTFQKLYRLWFVHLINKSIIALVSAVIIFAIVFCVEKIINVFKSISFTTKLLVCWFFVYSCLFWVQFGRYYWFPQTSIQNLTIVFSLLGIVTSIFLASLILVTGLRLYPRAISILGFVILLSGVTIPWLNSYKLKPKGQPTSGSPNIIYFMIDTIHADHMSTYGYHRSTSPNLKKFAESSVKYQWAFSPSNWTKPSVATYFSGLYPYQHGANLTRSVLPKAIPTLAENLRKQGYLTAGFSTNSFVSSFFGFNQGFNKFTLLRSSRLNGDGTFKQFLQNFGIRDWGIKFDPGPSRDDAENVNSHAHKWLKNRNDKQSPFFLYLHYMDPHDPYDPPKDHLGLKTIDKNYNYRQIKEEHLPGSPKINIYPFHSYEKPPEDILKNLIYQYDAEIRYWDHHFGNFINKLRSKGLMENSIVIVNGDHGEEFFQHGNWSHGQSVFNENIRVPLIIYQGKNVRQYEPGTTVKRPVNVRETYHYLLRKAKKPRRTPEPKQFNMAPFRSDTVGKPVYSSKVELSDIDLYSLVEYPWKIHRIDGQEKQAWRLYNLKNDPGENVDLKSDRRDLFKRLKDKLGNKIHAVKQKRYDPEKRELPPSLRKELKGLGYVN